MSAAGIVADQRNRVWSHEHGRDWNSSAGNLGTETAVVEAPRMPDNVYLPRSASYTYFPHVKDPIYEDAAVVELKGTISEDDLTLSNTSNGDATSYKSSGGSSPELEAPIELIPAPTKTVRSNSLSRIGISRLLSQKARDAESDGQDKPAPQQGGSTAEEERPRAPTRTLTKLRRKSWVSATSRSASPGKTTTEDGVVEDDAAAAKRRLKSASPSRRKSFIGRSRFLDKENRTASADAAPPQTEAGKKSRRPLSVLVKTPEGEEPQTPSKSATPASPTAPPVPAVPKSFSNDRLPSLLSHSSKPSPAVPPVPRIGSSEKIKHVKKEGHKKKDELWGVFRTLDSDYQKFHSKSLALKTNVIRTALLPFLRTYASHPSNRKIRPEDLERRAIILNKWWTGLLEMVAGPHNQSVSGTDRPAILEGMSGIMERPEWRTFPSPLCPLAERLEMTATPDVSTSSLTTNESDFVTESVKHNVRNIFTQNLLTQLVFVVDKMSLRTAPASLVTFSGKTCAYAFFFCPSVADILVRLWKPSMDVMQRVLQESGISKFDRADESFKAIVQAFPPNLHSLGFTTLAKTVRALRQPAQLPMGTQHVQWHGPWLKRWSGTESDLFYIFVKHFHILVTEFLPPDASHKEVMAAPGLLMVHAQILVNLDATIHRNACPQQQEDPLRGPSSVTFDDVLASPDATVSTLPLPPTNATRLMAENRLIMLVRDFLSERSAHVDSARHIFAYTFSHLLKAAATQIPIYDHNACYTLCDFLEEALILLVRYEQANPQKEPVLDWLFWTTACKRMVGSHNTTTEIRLYAFIYSIWTTVLKDKERRAKTCLDFLLEPEFFESRFNHWCPMVRAYYMRLLCWRLARHDEEAADGELDILTTLHDRLRTVWSHFLYLREQARTNQTPLPSTTPCSPAPGRRFTIVINNSPIAPPSSPFLSFDVFVSPNSSPPANRNSMFGSADNTSRPVSSCSDSSSDFGQSSPPEEAGKRKWGIFKSLLGGTRSKSRSPGPSRDKENMPTKEDPSTPSKSSDPSTDKPAPTTTTPSQQSPLSTANSPVPAYRSFSFRWHLDWVDKRFHLQNINLVPPMLPGPAQQFLRAELGPRPIVRAEKPTGAAARSSTYAGRALAEWTMIVMEHQNFFDRRRQEGVPANKWVETPTLGVEVIRRLA